MSRKQVKLVRAVRDHSIEMQRMFNEQRHIERMQANQFKSQEIVSQSTFLVRRLQVK